MWVFLDKKPRKSTPKTIHAEATPESKTNCLLHNEHPFSYFTCVITRFGWSCHHALYFRCTNMRNVGKSNQDAKIMTCYIHKHMLYAVAVPPNKFQVYLNHMVFLRPPCGKQHCDQDSQWISRWIQSLSSLDERKWMTCQKHAKTKKKKAKTEALSQDDVHTECKPAQKCVCV